jgi:hypothetical protein
MNTYVAYINVNIPLNYSYVSGKRCRENQKAHFVFDWLFFFFRESYCLWYNIEEYGRPDRPHTWHYNKTQAHCMLHNYRWVHTCNVTAYRKAVTFQVTDTIRSYDLNFHPVPNGITVSCERYTVGFPVCYGSHKYHDCKEGERSGR